MTESNVLMAASNLLMTESNVLMAESKLLMAGSNLLMAESTLLCREHRFRKHRGKTCRMHRGQHDLRHLRPGSFGTINASSAITGTGRPVPYSGVKSFLRASFPFVVNMRPFGGSAQDAASA